MNRKIYFIFALINFIFMIFIIGWLLYLSYRSFNKIDSSDIYKMSIDSIVEIKSADEDIGESYGTGVIYDSAGYLVTNAHVVCYTLLGETYAFSNIEIRFAKTEMYQSATLIKFDTNVDLAILKIDNDSMKFNPINFSKVECNFGEKVFAIGNMSNYGLGISEGVISVPEVNIKYDNKSRLVIQADIDISSGNSGGALLNEKGQIIGITTFRTKDNQGNINYGFAYSIPIKLVIEYIMEGDLIYE